MRSERYICQSFSLHSKRCVSVSISSTLCRFARVNFMMPLRRSRCAWRGSPRNTLRQRSGDNLLWLHWSFRCRIRLAALSGARSTRLTRSWSRWARGGVYPRACSRCGIHRGLQWCALKFTTSMPPAHCSPCWIQAVIKLIESIPFKCVWHPLTILSLKCLGRNACRLATSSVPAKR